MLKNDLVEVSVDAEGNLVSLKNLTTGHNYATGGYLWRMYYDTHGEREIEILGSDSSQMSLVMVKVSLSTMISLLFVAKRSMWH